MPVGTVIKNKDGKVIGDLDKEGVMFIAARGKWNSYTFNYWNLFTLFC